LVYYSIRCESGLCFADKTPECGNTEGTVTCASIVSKER
jgi:hypothetical protein